MEDLIEIIKPLDNRNISRISLATAGNKVLVSHNSFDVIISVENLFCAWDEFKKGKRQRADVREFERNLEDNIFTLSNDLKDGAYCHGPYERFRITDPKPREISKASVRDRLLHHAINRIVSPLFNLSFIYDSFSCRKEKGTHKAFLRLEHIVRKVSRNCTVPCWSLKCDIRKYFDSVDHAVLIQLLKIRIDNDKLLALLTGIINSFEKTPGKGMPLGNLTSQLFANIYLDPLDKFVKHFLKAKYYIRYADDFMVLGRDPDELMGYFVEMNNFLKNELKMVVHPDKIYLRKLVWGIDFVGYVALPHFSLPRVSTAKRIVRGMDGALKADPDKAGATLSSYLGYLGHVNAYYKSLQLIQMVEKCHGQTAWTVDKM